MCIFLTQKNENNLHLCLFNTHGKIIWIMFKYFIEIIHIYRYITVNGFLDCWHLTWGRKTRAAENFGSCFTRPGETERWEKGKRLKKEQTQGKCFIPVDCPEGKRPANVWDQTAKLPRVVDVIVLVTWLLYIFSDISNSLLGKLEIFENKILGRRPLVKKTLCP